MKQKQKGSSPFLGGLFKEYKDNPEFGVQLTFAEARKQELRWCLR